VVGSLGLFVISRSRFESDGSLTIVPIALGNRVENGDDGAAQTIGVGRIHIRRNRDLHRDRWSPKPDVAVVVSKAIDVTRPSLDAVGLVFGDEVSFWRGNLPKMSEQGRAAIAEHMPAMLGLSERERSATAESDREEKG
jgi:hypothetical protein